MKEQLEEIGSENTLIDFKMKDNFVVLYFNTFKLKILLDTYEEFKFKIGETYKKEFIEQLIFINNKFIIENYLISKTSKHIYSEYDIRILSLKKFPNISSDDIDAAIADLKKSDLINDSKYVEQYVEYFNNSYYGKYYMTNFFHAKRIDNKIISKIVFNDEKEALKAKNYMDLIKNKYVSNNIAKQKKKLYDALLKRGFNNDIVIELLDSLEVDPQKEHDKLLKAYSKAKKKYVDNDGKLMENKLISYLVYKGYNYQDVEEVINEDTNGEIKDD